MEKNYLLIMFCFLVAISLKAQFGESNCSLSFNNSVQVNELLFNNKSVGNSIWINRSNASLKAYYICTPENQSAIDYYNTFRKNKKIVLFTSGAYASGFSSNSKPMGLTIQDGEVKNFTFSDNLGAIVIVEKVGGIRIIDWKNDNINVLSVSTSKRLDLKSSLDRLNFIKWAKEEKATIFQTHILISNNQSRVYRNASSTSTVRKLLLLVRDNTEKLYHIIWYPKEKFFSLDELSDSTIKYFKGIGMKIIAGINLDTGSIDLLGTGGDAKNCEGNYVTGTSSDRSTMCNMLFYYTN